MTRGFYPDASADLGDQSVISVKTPSSRFGDHGVYRGKVLVKAFPWTTRPAVVNGYARRLSDGSGQPEGPDEVTILHR